MYLLPKSLPASNVSLSAMFERHRGAEGPLITIQAVIGVAAVERLHATILPSDQSSPRCGHLPEYSDTLASPPISAPQMRCQARLQRELSGWSISASGVRQTLFFQSMRRNLSLGGR